MFTGKCLYCALLFALCTGLVACSGKLTRKEAKKSLEKFYRDFTADDIAIFVVTGTVSDNCALNGKLIRSVSDEGDYRLLTRMGLVHVEPEHAKIAKVDLTEAGKKAAVEGPYGHHITKNCDSWQYTIPLTTLDKVEVTGIQQEGTNARVEYTLCRKLTTIGKQARDLHPTEDETASVLGFKDALEHLGDKESYCHFTTSHFAKYDDGWRKQ